MGVEYRVPFDMSVSQAWDRVLRAAPYFSEYNQLYHHYEFRSPHRQNLNDMPDSVVAVEPNGLYVCDNGNQVVVQAILNAIQTTLIAAGHTFTLEEYE